MLILMWGSQIWQIPEVSSWGMARCDSKALRQRVGKPVCVSAAQGAHLRLADKRVVKSTGLNMKLPLNAECESK